MPGGRHHEIEPPLAGTDDDGAGGVRPRKRNDLAWNPLGEQPAEQALRLGRPRHARQKDRDEYPRNDARYHFHPATTTCTPKPARRAIAIKHWRLLLNRNFCCGDRKRAGRLGRWALADGGGCAAGPGQGNESRLTSQQPQYFEFYYVTNSTQSITQSTKSPTCPHIVAVKTVLRERWSRSGGVGLS
jgi:hypothetical protein